jgi:uncharacterized protein
MATTPPILQNIVLFGRVLRGVGFDFGPSTAADAAAALGHVGLSRRGDVRSALCSLVVRRREDLALFDDAFDAFWRKPTEGFTDLDLRSMGERRRFRKPRFETTPRLPPDAEPTTGDEKVDDRLLRVTATYSERERLSAKDFAELTAEERREVEELLRRRSLAVRARRSRRLRPGRGARLDMRRTLRRALRYGGEAMTLLRQRPKAKPRPLIILADVSGSMERYTRMLLFLAFALEGGARNVETFVFGTRLTRLTRELRGRSVDAALDRAARAVPDWSGGTRIGDALHAFNFEWGRRVRLGSAVVLLISDGWDRGDEELLREEMARLQRGAHRVIWLNPLLGDPAYEPLTKGMKTALPFVDDFLPVHNLASLDDLARRLEALDGTRPSRGSYAEIASRSRL